MSRPGTSTPVHAKAAHTPVARSSCAHASGDDTRAALDRALAVPYHDYAFQSVPQRLSTPCSASVPNRGPTSAPDRVSESECRSATLSRTECYRTSGTHTIEHDQLYGLVYPAIDADSRRQGVWYWRLGLMSQPRGMRWFEFKGNATSMKRPERVVAVVYGLYLDKPSVNVPVDTY